jgi:hypothetical protein
MKYDAMAVSNRPNKMGVKSNFFMTGQAPDDSIE